MDKFNKEKFINENKNKYYNAEKTRVAIDNKNVVISKALVIVWVLVMVVVLATISIIMKNVYDKKYDYNNLSVSVTNKSNGSLSFTMYETNIELEVENNSILKVNHLYGEMIITTKSGEKTLWEGDISLSGDLLANEKGVWNLSLSTKDNSIWEYSLSEMQIKFRITSVSYSSEKRSYIKKDYSEDYKIIR